MINRIKTRYKNKHKNDCHVCKGRGFYYPSSNMGGSCVIACPICKGTGLNRLKETI